MEVMGRNARIVVVGGGYVGMYTALRLQRTLRRGEADITVIDPQPHMTYQPFLPEAAAGSIEPRHVVVPLRRVLKKCHHLTGRVTAIQSREPRGHRGARRRSRHHARVRRPRRRSRLGGAHPADPRAGRVRHRVQDRRRGDLPAQPRAVPARRRRHHDGSGAAQTAAHVPGGRRRLRRDRGARRAGQDMARYASRYYEDIAPRGRPVGARRGRRADHAGGGPEDGPLHRGAAARRGDRGQPGHQGEDHGGRARRPRRRAGVRDRHDHVDSRGQAQPDAGADGPAARRSGPHSSARPSCRSWACRTCSAPATARRCRTCPRTTRRPAPARRRSTPSARPRCWPTTWWRTCAAGR